MTVKRGLKKIFDLTDKAMRTRMLLRVLSLALAVSLWLFVTWDGTALKRRTMDIPLKYIDLQDGHSVSNPVTEISVSVEGRIETLAAMDRNEMTASVSLHDLIPGKYTLPVQLEIPDGLRVTDYSPQTVELELFRIIERKLQPSLVVSGDMPENFSLGEVNISPKEVVARGPEAAVIAIKRAKVVGSAASLMTGINMDLPVLLENDDDRDAAAPVTVTPAKVWVNAKIVELIDQKTVPVKAATTGVPSDGFDVASISLSPDMVTLRGARSILLDITEIKLNDIDVTGHYESMDADIPIDPPAPGLSVVGAQNVNVRVDFNSAIEMMTFQDVAIRVEGSGAYDEWILSPAMASVTMERIVASTEPFDLDNPPVELYVDVTNIVSRRLVLPILTREISDDVRTVRVDPDQISVRAVVR
jgi:YbbR domain-containing protein